MGACGTIDCCFERVPQIRTREAPPDGSWVTVGKEEGMDVFVERCAGLDVHRDSVMATVRLPATRRRQRERHTRGFASTLGGLQGGLPTGWRVSA